MNTVAPPVAECTYEPCVNLRSYDALIRCAHYGQRMLHMRPRYSPRPDGGYFVILTDETPGEWTNPTTRVRLKVNNRTEAEEAWNILEDQMLSGQPESH